MRCAQIYSSENREDLNNERTQIKVSVDLKPLFDTATDCLRFVTEFFEVSSESAPHIYHSALPLAPTSSIIRKLYGQHISSAVRIVTGVSPSWDSCTAIAGGELSSCHAIWSPCGQYIATGSGQDVHVHDSTTLEVSYTLKFSRPGDDPKFLAFSPDGHFLICGYYALT